MKEIRLGTIGSGVIVHSILDNVTRTKGIRLEAVYSRQEEKGKALAQEYGADKVYTDMELFLLDPDINVVYIATPNLLHYEQTKKALEAGKHVICEKPFCIRAEQVKELMELAKEKDLMLVEAIPTSFLPNYREIRERLPPLGRIRLVMANYSQFSSRYNNLLAGEVPNIFNPQFAGGCLMDINYYNVYLTVALFGRPESAVYYPNRYVNGIDTSGMVQMSYPDLQVSCAGAKDTKGVNYYQIEGENGYLYVTDGSNGLKEVRIVTGDQEETVDLQPDPDRLYYEIQALTALLLAEDMDTLRARLQMTYDTVCVVENMRKAAGIFFPGDVSGA